MIRRSNLSLALSMVLVFASGAVVGAVGFRYYNLRESSAGQRPPRSPDDYRNSYLKEMKTRLHLNGDQTRQLEAVLDETRNQFRELREKHRPEFRALQDAQTEKINSMLNADQQAEYARMRAERDARRKAEESKRK
ncbi:MAG: hypothetical protein HY858_00270 [Candidatus Solibacter usitatus]|nr:hypothetical protein [Candidatus Solibacter usitatus]